MKQKLMSLGYNVPDTDYSAPYVAPESRRRRSDDDVAVEDASSGSSRRASLTEQNQLMAVDVRTQAPTQQDLQRVDERGRLQAREASDSRSSSSRKRKYAESDRDLISTAASFDGPNDRRMASRDLMPPPPLPTLRRSVQRVGGSDVHVQPFSSENRRENISPTRRITTQENTGGLLSQQLQQQRLESAARPALPSGQPDDGPRAATEDISNSNSIYADNRDVETTRAYMRDASPGTQAFDYQQPLRQRPGFYFGNRFDQPTDVRRPREAEILELRAGYARAGRITEQPLQMPRAPTLPPVEDDELDTQFTLPPNRNQAVLTAAPPSARLTLPPASSAGTRDGRVPRQTALGMFDGVRSSASISSSSAQPHREPLGRSSGTGTRAGSSRQRILAGIQRAPLSSIREETAHGEISRAPYSNPNAELLNRLHEARANGVGRGGRGGRR